MLKKRLIPVLLLQNGSLVRSEGFSLHQIIGDPIYEVKRFNQWSVDELIYLDISETDSLIKNRSDKRDSNFINRNDILKAISKTCFMPLTWGGRITSIVQMEDVFKHGADKVSINSQAFLTPNIISDAANIFGSQAIVVCIDVRKSSNTDSGYEVFINRGKTSTKTCPIEWAKKVSDLGAGEILLQSIDNDGMGRGYDVDLISQVSTQVKVPIIALGGVGDYNHYSAGLDAGASAVASANIWHFKELADRAGKRAIQKAGHMIRTVRKHHEHSIL